MCFSRQLVKEAGVRLIRKSVSSASQLSSSPAQLMATPDSHRDHSLCKKILPCCPTAPLAYVLYKSTVISAASYKNNFQFTLSLFPATAICHSWKIMSLRAVWLLGLDTWQARLYFIIHLLSSLPPLLSPLQHLHISLQIVH